MCWHVCMRLHASNGEDCHIFFLNLGLTPYKAEQPLQGMELQEKEHKKTKAYRKSV